MKNLLHLLILFFFAKPANAQFNLVPNPSFDQTVTSCPSQYSQWYKCANWSNVNSIITNTTGCGYVYGTPDYYNSCGTGSSNMPLTGWGSINSNSGSGMMGLVFFSGYVANYREYIANTLECPLIPGVTYSVSLFSTHGYTNNLSVKHIGVVLSLGPLIQNCGNLISNQIPQFETNSNNYISSSSWTPISFTLIPTTSLDHITIGNFRNDANSSVSSPSPAPSISYAPYANYFFDDVSVVPVISINTVVTQPNCIAPCGSASIVPTNSLLNYTYLWSPGNYTSSSVPCLSSGIYTVSIFLEAGCSSVSTSVQFTINPSPIPTISIASPAPPFCEGNCINLIASGATNYTWLPSNSSGNSTWVCPTTSSTYSVFGINSFSCTSMTTLNINTSPNPTISISTIPIAFCMGSNATLTASGGVSYTWQPNNWSGNPLIILNPTSSSVISVFGTNSVGCIGSSLVTLNTPLSNPTISLNSAPVIRCNGTPATITAIGANSYTWQPGSQVSNSIIINPLSSIILTVQGLATNGCTTNLIYTLTAPIPNPIINVVSNPSIICPGYSNTLTATGASNYYWLPTSSNSNPITVSPTNNVTYYVFGTSSLGCQGYTTVTLNLGAQMNLTSNNYTFCTNASTSIPIMVNTSLSNLPLTFTWQPVSQNGQQIIVSPTSTTIYTVTASSSAVCPSTNTLSVFVTSNCCSQPTTGLTLLTSLTGSYMNTSYLITNSIVLNGNSTFQDAELLMMPNARIIVPSSKTLDLDHVHLYACGINMWEGIKIQDGGQIITSNHKKKSNLIEDAKIGIELDTISSAHTNPPIFIDNTIFNNNFIGIKISNGPTLTTLPLKISECVFTSRNLPFTSPAPFINCNSCWPSTDNNFGGLRTPNSPTFLSSLSSPFPLQNVTPTNNLKLPYSTPRGQAGILINNIGNNSGNTVNPGVDIGSFFSNLNNRFNLFDNLGIGIEVEDASLTTINNVFQNIQPFYANNYSANGIGIKHSITGIMNAMLDLSPITNINIDGNKFWNCWEAINANNLYLMRVENSVFRSDRNVFTGNGRGNFGINYNSNRFSIMLKNNEFSNIDNNCNIDITSGNYDFGILNNGTYAGNLDISQNYFGPEVLSNNPILVNSEYCNNAITLNGSLASNWQYAGNGVLLSNKIDRAFRGINFESFASYSTEIGGNDIKILDDNIISPGSLQYGIYAKNSDDNLIINQNTIVGEASTNPGNWNTNLKCVLSENNKSISGSISPIISCNQTYDAYIGFEFDGKQANTSWIGNTMYQKMKIGLSLVNGGEIGIQGNASIGCGDLWDDNLNTSPFSWISPSNYQTLVDASSNAWPGSFLWCAMPGTIPTINGSLGSSMPFMQGAFGTTMASLDYAKLGYDCVA